MLILSSSLTTISQNLTCCSLAKEDTLSVLVCYILTSRIAVRLGQALFTSIAHRRGPDAFKYNI